MRDGAAGQACRSEEDVAPINPGAQEEEQAVHGEPLIGRAHAGEAEARLIRELLLRENAESEGRPGGCAD